MSTSSSNDVSVSGSVSNNKAEASGVGRPTRVEDLPPVMPDENYKPGSLEFIRYNYKNLSVLKQELAEITPKPESANSAWTNDQKKWHRLR